MSRAIVLLVISACAPAQLRADEAEAAYFAEQLRCVDQAKTRAEADACRERVRQEWARAADAGSDGAR